MSTEGSAVRKTSDPIPVFMGFVCLWFAVLAFPGANPLRAQAPILLDFHAGKVGALPEGWKSRGNGAAKVYSVQAEGTKKFLHADAVDESTQIGYETKWELDRFPVLEWQWRAELFPDRTDERKKRGGDSVLGVYVVFGRPPFIKSIKYIWSDTLPVGASFDSPFSSASKIVVIRTGRSPTGAWVAEKRDVLSDYRRLFGDETARPTASAIAVLTDSDNTHSHAVGDYADIRVVGREGGKASRQ